LFTETKEPITLNQYVLNFSWLIDQNDQKFFFKTGTKYGKNQQKLPGDISQILFSKSLYFCLEQKHRTWNKNVRPKIYMQWTIRGV